MRKTCAIGFAAFYLLLTTGMFVCIFHCVSEYFLKPQVSISLHSEEARSHDENKLHSLKDGSKPDIHKKKTMFRW